MDELSPVDASAFQHHETRRIDILGFLPEVQVVDAPGRRRRAMESDRCASDGFFDVPHFGGGLCGGGGLVDVLRRLGAHRAPEPRSP